MSKRSTASVLIYEPVYLLLWLVLATALLVTGKATAKDLALLAGQALILIALMAKGREGMGLQARLWFPVLALNLTYFWLGDAVPRLQQWRADDALLGIDRSIFGDCLALKLAPSIPGWMRELLSGAYLLFFPLWVTAIGVAAWRGGKFQRAFFNGFHLVYVLGFAGYSLFPAAGPFRYPPLADQLADVDKGGWISTFNDKIVRGACNGVDVFPSLHTAITIFVLLSAFNHSRRLFAIIAAPCFLIVSATIGLQYHYVADLAAGLLLGGTVWWFTVRPCNWSASPLFKSAR